jgi:hypothetical protein
VGRRNPLFDSNHAGFPIVSGSFSSLSHPRRRFSWAGERRQRTSNLQFALPPVATRNGLAPPRKIGAKTRQKWSFSPSYLPHGGTDSPPRPPRHSHRMLKNAHSLPTKFLEYPQNKGHAIVRSHGSMKSQRSRKTEFSNPLRPTAEASMHVKRQRAKETKHHSTWKHRNSHS